MKILLDLDRTLFDTDKFVGTLWPWMGEAYGIDVESARGNMAQYFQWVDDMYNYDFFAHIADLGIDGTDVVKRAPEVFKDTIFIYDDALEFLRRTEGRDRAILTFGGEQYQQFKLSFCPQLIGLSVYMTLRHKEEVIAEKFKDGLAVIVDDKLLSGALPPSVRFIHINRAQTQPIAEHDGYSSVRLLTDIRGEWLDT